MAKKKVTKKKVTKKTVKAEKKVETPKVEPKAEVTEVSRRKIKVASSRTLKECAITLAGQGRLDKAIRTAEAIQDKAKREEIVKQIESMRK
jgi:hypothetical protein